MAKACKIPDFNPNLSLNSSVEKIIKVRFSELFLFRENCIINDDSNVEAIHDMRVASRRLQTVLKLFDKYFPKSKFKFYSKKVKKLIKLLGNIREQDVFRKIIDDYKKNLPEEDKKVIDIIITRQMKVRTAEHRKLVQFLVKLDRKKFREKFLNFVTKPFLNEL